MMILNKDPKSWTQVVPDAVLSGSTAQARNVMQMAIQDIAAQGTRITDLETALLAATDLAKRQCERIEELEAENTRIRAALAQSERPCAYCSLPAEEWSKCASGFPGCARGDDALGCPHLGDGLRVKELEAERDARPVARWVNTDSWPGRQTLYFGHVAVGFIAPHGGTWKAHPPHTEFHPTPEAAKAAVEEALNSAQRRSEQVGPK